MRQPIATGFLLLFAAAQVSAREPSAQMVRAWDETIEQLLAAQRHEELEREAISAKDPFLAELISARLQANRDTSGRQQAAEALRGLIDKSKSPAVQAILYERLADVHQALGNYARVAQDLGAAADAAGAANDHRGELRLLTRLGDTLVSRSTTPRRGQEAYLRAVGLALALDDEQAFHSIQQGLSAWAARTNKASDLLSGFAGAVDAFPFAQGLGRSGGWLFHAPPGLLYVGRRQLARFDGMFLESLPMPTEADLVSLGQLPDGRLLAGTEEGIFVATPDGWLSLPVELGSGVAASDGDNGIWVAVGDELVHYVFEQGVVETRPLPALGRRRNRATAITAAPDGTLFVATTAGVEAIDGDASHFYKAGRDLPIDVLAVVPERDGSIWFLATEGAVRYQGSRLLQSFYPSGLVGNPSVRSLLRASDGRLWMGLGRGVARLDGDEVGLFLERAERYEQVFGLAEWPTGAIWFLNDPGELVRIGSPRLQLYDRAVLPSAWVFSIHPEAEDSLLLGTGTGAVRFNPKSREALHYADADHCVGMLELLVPLRGGGWMGSTPISPCVFIERKGKVKTFRPRSGMPEVVVTALGEFRGRPCLGSDQGVWCLLPRPGAKEAWLVPQPLEFLRNRPISEHGLVLESDGSLLVSVSDEGVFRVRPAYDRPQKAEPIGHGTLLPPVRIIDTGAEVLLGTASVIRQLHGSELLEVPGVPAMAGLLAGLRLDDGTLLLSFRYKGLLVSDGQDWNLLTEQDGIAGLLIYDIARDADGSIWLGLGGLGLARMQWQRTDVPETIIVSRTRAYFRSPEGSGRQLDVVELRRGEDARADGVPSKAPANETWLESAAGLFSMSRAHCLPLVSGSASPAASPPSLLARLPASSGVDSAPYRSGRLQIALAAITPHRSLPAEAHLYRYRLDGGPWIALGHQTELVLDGLANGEHALEVIAKGKLLEVDPTPAVLRFTVEKPLPIWVWVFPMGFVALIGGWQRRRIWTGYLWARHFRRFRPIDQDPFVPTRPAEGQRLMGRKQVLETLSATGRQGGAAVAVWGERGAGKTSILKALRARLQRDGVLTVERDLAAIVAGGNLAELIQGFCDGLAEVTGILETPLEAASLPEEGVEPGDPGPTARPGTPTSLGMPLSAAGASGQGSDMLGASLSFVSQSPDSNPFTGLSRALERLEKFQPRARIAFLLDNAEVLALAVESDATYGSYFFHFLRSMAQQRVNASVFLAMEGRWFQLGQRFEQLFTFATAVATDRLTPEAGQQLFQNALQGLALIPEHPLASLVDLTGGHPYLMQLSGRHLVAVLNEVRSNVCSVDIVDEVSRRLLGDPETRLDSSWAGLTRVEKLIVAALCEKGHAGRQGRPEQVLDWLGEAGAKLLPEEVRRGIVSLEAGGLGQTGPEGFSLRGELFCRWVARHHSMGAVLEGSYDYVGTYQLVERLGAGGMGVVYKARDMAGGDTVALKLLRPELSENRRSRRRFLREARLGKRLRHANIVRIVDYGEQGGRLYLAMEYLKGETLARWVKSHTADAALAAEVGQRIASALAAIHDEGILHRDVKSENIMLPVGEHGALEPTSAKLMDFGLAVGEDVSRMTRDGAVLGTVGYMAPEQARGDVIDARSDLYSLGAVLYELLCGRPPFAGPDLAAMLNAVIHDRPSPIREHCPDLPASLSGLIEALLEKDKEARPQNAEEVEERLQEVVEALGPASAAALQPAKDRSGKVRDGFAASGVVTRSVISLRADRGLATMVPDADADTDADDDSMVRAEETEHDVPRLILLHGLAASVARGSEREAVLQDCLVQAARALGAERGVVLLSPQADDLECATAFGPKAKALTKIPAVASMVQRSISERSGFLYSSESPESPGPTVCAPLWAGDQIFGAMLVTRVRTGNKFEHRDLEFLASVGYLGGLALERHDWLASQHLTVIGRMLAGVAHDLRNPMTVITGYAQLLGLEDQEEARKEGCQRIMTQVERMTDMIGDLLAFARGDSRLHPSMLVLPKFGAEIRESLRVQCEPRGIEVTVEAQEGKIRVDVGRTKRILYNLAQNAVDVLSRGEKLRIRLQIEDGALQLQVIDTGPGIPKEVRGRVFEPFVTSGKHHGTGLGLSIVKRFIADHNGRMALESAEGAGTVFTVWLPPCSFAVQPAP